MNWFERAIWGSKALLVLVGMVSTMTLLKTTVQYLTSSILPQLWMSVCPLYIYLLLNFIILAIAATSTFPAANKYSPSSEDHTTYINQKPLQDKSIISWRSFHILQEKKSIADESSVETVEKLLEDDGGVVVGKEDSSETDSINEYSTLEATWKAIMERQRRTEELTRSDKAPLARAADHEISEEDHKENAQLMVETFSELTKDESLSEEELNRRAEAFINKVNNDIRLQTLQSDHRFQDILNPRL